MSAIGMNGIDRGRIAAAFARAGDYDRNARVQRDVAALLADRIAALRWPRAPRILEIGCGTGFLTQALIDRGVDGEWLVTDIAPAMVGRCRAHLGEGPGRRFAVLDGEYGTPPGAGGFDLICSSLAMQWFDDQARGLSRMLGWLAPGGQCLFATLAADSFAEWRQAHVLEGLTPGTPDFLPVPAFEAMAPRARRAAPEVHLLVERHPDAIGFVRALKAIGAGTATRRHRPLSPADLRRVMRRFEAGGAAVTYEVVIGHYSRPEDRVP